MTDILKNYPTLKIVLIVITCFIILWLINSWIIPCNQENFAQYPSAGDETLIPSQEIVDTIMPQPSTDYDHNASPVPSGWNNSGKDITPLDLLPSSTDANVFDAQFPSTAGDLSSKNFLTAGYSIGINTVSSSLRNANTGLRSDPYIPTKTIGPWNQSTIVPDLNRKPMDIGTSSC